jgi:hypothetical protein
MSLRDKIVKDASRAMESKLVPLATGLSKLAANNKKVAAVIFFNVLDQKLLRETLDACKTMVDDEPVGKSQRFTIFLAGEDGEHYGMFDRLWRSYIADPGIACPDFPGPGDENRFLSKIIGQDFGLPGKVYIDDIIDFDNEVIADMIGGAIYCCVRTGARIILVGGDVLDLAEVVGILKKNLTDDECELVPLLAKCS